MQSSQPIIIILLVANLVATVWFGLNEKPSPVLSQTERTATHELPSAVNSQVRDQLYNQFSKAFNEADYDVLYDMFGPTAKIQVSKEKSTSEFKKLLKYFHSVKSGGFTHSELVDTQGNTNIYVLHYAVKLSELSEFGTKGTLRVTVAVQGSEYQVYGIRLNAG